jgi:hypothetical protein
MNSGFARFLNLIQNPLSASTIMHSNFSYFPQLKFICNFSISSQMTILKKIMTGTTDKLIYGKPKPI